jgi:hypothetical protein
MARVGDIELKMNRISRYGQGSIAPCMRWTSNTFSDHPPGRSLPPMLACPLSILTRRHIMHHAKAGNHGLVHCHCSFMHTWEWFGTTLGSFPSLHRESKRPFSGDSCSERGACRVPR